MNADRLHPLAGDQAAAVSPHDTVWLSASAGTGKTQVLTARVLRLLLEPGITPDAILALTFTRAGAAEMAARINATLARWVRADASRLGADLIAIGAMNHPETRARARTRFAAVLDCPGGGLRIDTIHAFSQWLLAAFPEEAGLIAGTRPMEEHEADLLAHEVLAEVLTDAETAGEDGLIEGLARLTVQLGEAEAIKFLQRCAAAQPLWASPAWQQGALGPRVRAVLGLQADASMADLAAMLSDDAFDVALLVRVREGLLQWRKPTGDTMCDAIGVWLAADPAGRLDGLEAFAKATLTDKRIPSQTVTKALMKLDPEAADALDRFAAALAAVFEHRTLVELAEWLTPALEMGRAYAQAWDASKARAGLIDFDDQIRAAAALLAQAPMAGWIRYKLDRQFDHILVDEAQDTNAEQWDIIEALVDEFFAGEGAGPPRLRSLFVVGDHKQAIFGFQGTSPQNFRDAGGRVAARMAGAARNAADVRGGPRPRDLRELGLGQSFRTAAPVLAFVDRAIAHIGPPAFGLPADTSVSHLGQNRPGVVALWQPINSASAAMADHEASREGDSDEGGSSDSDNDASRQGWLSKPERQLADTIAEQIAHWHHHGYPLHKDVKEGQPPRRGDAGDVMVLVRRRGALAALIVARLNARGVPVAGVDRLRLAGPLAVQDLLAALRFAAQPLDDLNLAGLLVSPLIGWTQADLLAHGYRPAGTSLWGHLRASSGEVVTATLERLGTLLARADFEPVQGLLHWLLVGPWQGRAALVGRLGHDANDPIDELLNAAYAYAATQTASLTGFLAWFGTGDSGGGGGELKREAGRAGGFVRVMTVHGAKGLQAPIVILADACAKPDAGRPKGLSLADPHSALGGGKPLAVPMPPLGKARRVGRLEAAATNAAKAEAEEHWRLLYVAMTRAEEALFITGALSPSAKAVPPESWFARLSELWGAPDWQEDAVWGRALVHGAPPPPPVWGAREQRLGLVGLPGWAGRPAPDEPRPARPLAPSALGEEAGTTPPAAASHAAAARRGTLIHRLLERLPDVAEGARAGSAARWLDRAAADLTQAARDEMAAAALGVMTDPQWAAVFGPDSLAEVPVTARVGGQVIAGTIDRLVMGPEAIRIVDFKTTRRPAATLGEVPTAVLRQLAAYALALAAAYPKREVAAAILYTAGPTLIAIDPDILAVHKAGLLVEQQSLAL